MNYIYDILLNYGDVPYDFFEWNKSDNILHIRKIPLIKVGASTLKDIMDYEIKLDSSFINKIKRKTEIFNNKNIRLLDVACLFSDGVNVLAIMIKNNRLLKSKLLLEEDEEVLAISEKLKEQEIIYTKIKKCHNIYYKTRKQIENEYKMRIELNKMFREKNNETLKYIYYECFNKKEASISIIRKKFFLVLDEYDEQIIGKLKNILKLLEIKH